MAPPPTGTTNASDAQLTDEQWGLRLASRIGAQVERYQQLAEITAGQSAAVESGNTDDLLSALARRQVIIQQITDANADLAPFIQAWQTRSRGITADLTATIRQSMDALDELVEQINAADERDRQALEAKRTAVSAELTGVAKRRTAMHAYASRPASGPRYQDRQG